MSTSKLHGVVKDSKFGFSFITGQDGRDYFVPACDMPWDDVGRKYLLAGEEVMFTKGTRPGSKYPLAENVELMTPREPVPAEYIEQGRVRTIKRNYCFVERPYGGVALLHRDAVRPGSPYFQLGQWWQWRIEPPICGELTRPWCAVHAETICEPVAGDGNTAD